MLTYWLMYLIPASIALFLGRRQQSNQMLWISTGFIFILIIGFRFEVGGDWFNYIRHYDQVIGASLKQAMHGGDPAHKYLNFLMARWNLGVYGTNVVYSGIFMWGLIRFSRQQSYPWLAIVAAVPYLIIVVVMGYSRQAVAIGLFLLAVSYLDKGKFKTYVGIILLAALFHKTALLLLPLGIFLYGKGLTLRLLMIVPIAYGAWDLLLADRQEHLWKSYVEEKMQSDGAKIRVVMNLIPSLLLLKYRKEWKRSFDDYRFWFWIALGSIVSVFLVSAASTAVDRIALYFIPIQLVVFARLPYLARKHVKPSTMKVVIVLGYVLVLFVWLNYATHAKYWLPYQNILFMDIL